MRTVAMAMCALTAVACTKGDVAASTDVRIDGAAGDVESHGTRMCVNISGIITVLWVDDRDGTQAVWLTSSRDDGETWLDPVQVNHGDGVADHPTLACTHDYVFVAWEDDRDGALKNPNVYFNRSPDFGATWDDEDLRMSPDPDGATRSLGPQLAAKGNEVFLGWQDTPNGAFDVFVRGSLDNGATWTNPARLDTDAPGAAFSGNVQIGTDGAAHVYVAWEDSRDGNSDIYARASNDGGVTWAFEQRLDQGELDDPGEHDSFAPRLAAEDGLVYVVWHDRRNGAQRDIYAGFSNNHGQNWSTEARRIDSDSAGFFDSLYPSVDLEDGRAWVAWQDARNGGYDIYVRDTQLGQFDAAETRMDTDSPGVGNSLNAQVVVEGPMVVVVWEDRRADDEGLGYDEIYYNWSPDSGATWATDDLRIDSIAEGTSYANEIQVALREGVIYAAWTDGRRGNADVYFHALPVGDEAGYVLE